jgi:hypothetical protein
MKLQMQQTREHPLRRTYERAINVSQMKLTPTHPLRLRAALNYSVLSYELLKEQEKAVALAKKALMTQYRNWTNWTKRPTKTARRSCSRCGRSSTHGPADKMRRLRTEAHEAGGPYILPARTPIE